MASELSRRSFIAAGGAFGVLALAPPARVRSLLEAARAATGDGRFLTKHELATLRADAAIGADVDALRWTGPRSDLAAWSERLGTPALHERVSRLAAARAAVMG